MSNQIVKKFIADNAIDGDKLELENGQAVRHKLSEGNVVNLIRLDDQGRVMIATGEAATKDDISGVQTNVGNVQSEVDDILFNAADDKNSFAEIVAYINGIDEDNDEALNTYMTATDLRLSLVEDDVQELTSLQNANLVVTLTSSDIGRGYVSFSGLSKSLVEGSVRAFNGRLAMHPEVDFHVTESGTSTYSLNFIKEMYNGLGSEDVLGNAKNPSEEAPEEGDAIVIYYQVKTQA